MLLKIISVIVGILFIFIAALLLLSSLSIPGVPLNARAVLTGSMEPTIPTGSIVFITPAAPYAEGDIITFKRKASVQEIPITHRIVRVEETQGGFVYTTQGDANEVQDLNTVAADEVIGKVVLHVPYVGTVLNFAKTPLGFAILIIVPGLLVIFDEGRKIWREVRGRRVGAGQETP